MQELFSVYADLACFAKGVANGYPIAAVTGKKEIMKVMEGLQVTTTYGGEALSLAAVVAALEEYKKKKVHAYLWRIGKKLMDGLNKIARESGVNIRWLGYAPMSSFKFMYDEETSSKMMTVFLQECARKGVLFRRGGLVLVTFSHTEKDVENTLKTVEDVLNVIKKYYDKNRLDELLKNTGKTAESIRKFG